MYVVKLLWIASFNMEKKEMKDAACLMVNRISDKYPVIIMADRGYENYNLFAHIEERLLDYVIRIRNLGAVRTMVAGFDFSSNGPFNLTRDSIITRHSTGSCIVNLLEKWLFISKIRKFHLILCLIDLSVVHQWQWTYDVITFLYRMKAGIQQKPLRGFCTQTSGYAHLIS